MLRKQDNMKRRVLIVSTFLRDAGLPPSTCYALSSLLTQAGLEVVTTSSKYGRLPRLVDMMVTAWRERDRYSVACVDLFSGPAFIWAEAVCWTLRRAGKPYILMLRGGDLPLFASARAARVRRLLQSASTVVAPSGYLAEQMRAYRDDIRVLPNGIHLSAYRFKLRSPPRPRLAWLRSLCAIYNPCMAVRVVAELSAEWPDLELVMAGADKGDGSMQQVERLAAELGVQSRVKLPGQVPKEKVPELLDQADVFLNTTNIDNTPVSVIEAMACGLCVVSTNVGGVPYLVQNGHDAILVPADDAPAMAEAVRHLLREPVAAESLSRNARHTAERCDWSRIIPQWESLFGEVGGW